MASYTRLGTYLLANELTVDPAGKIHRGLTLSGSSLERHVLIRTFSEELLEAGMGSRLEEASRVAGLLAGQRGFGHGYKIEGGRTPHVACDYVQGRSLAQMLDKAKHEQIPLGVDHALSVLQSLAQSLVQLHAKGLSHGVLSPHSVWVTFEGATHILDAPFASSLQALLPKCPILSASRTPYQGPAGTSALQQDLFALGAVFYELLTLDRLPSLDLLTPTLNKATLKAAQDDSLVPPEILGILKRLLGVDKVFESPSVFITELERVLYDGDYSPTTFNMAFFMHTLFREENEHDTQAMKMDQGADFSPFLESEPSKGKLFETAGGQSYTKYVVMAGAGMVALLGLLGYKSWSDSQALNKKTAELAMVQRESRELSDRLTDITRQEQQAQANKSLGEKQLKEAKTADEKKRAQAKIDEANLQQATLQKQKVETQQQAQQAAQRAQTIAQLPATAKPAPADQKPAPTPASTQPGLPVAQINPGQLPSQLPSQLPKSLPPATNAPATSTPAPATATPAPAATADVPELPPTITRRAIPSAPRLANKNFLPPELRVNEIRVTVKVFVDPNGRPLKVTIEKGVDGPFGYNDAAKQAAYESTYTPATKGGKAINGWITLDYNFGKPK